MPTCVLGTLPGRLGGALLPCPGDGEWRDLFLLRTLGRAAARRASPEPREDGLRLLVAEDDLLSALSWPGLAQKPGTPPAVPRAAWRDDIQGPCLREKACRLPWWSAGQDARDGDSSVSSGRLSGSSGGHRQCASPLGPWQRPPQMWGPPRQPRKKDRRLEQLRDKIRAQARRQASHASLGTSAPSSASHLRRASPPLQSPAHPGPGVPCVTELGAEDGERAGLGPESCGTTQRRASIPREKTKRIKSCSCRREKAPGPPSPGRAARGKDSESVGVHAWRKGRTLARLLLGPPPARPRLRSDPSPAAKLGDKKAKKATATKDSPGLAWSLRPFSARSDQQLSRNTLSLTSCDQPAAIQTAMAILRDLRRQIQAGLELAQGPRAGRKLGPRRAKTQSQAERRRRGPQSSFCKGPGAVAEERPGLDSAGGLHSPQPWSSEPEPEPEPEPWPRTAWVAGEWESSLRPGSPRERPFSPRPWSTSGQARPQRARAAREDWGVPAPRPWSALETPGPAPQRCRSGLPVGRAGPSSPWAAGQAWPGPPEEQQEARPPPACPEPLGPRGRLHSSASVREFMRQKAQARRQRALEQKAQEARARELRGQRLRDVYRKQREAVLGQPAPRVSQTSPGIVTFVPRSAQSGDLEAPGGLASLPQWSKVTSGTVLGDQEAPGSFCLCLNRAWDHTEALEPGRAPPLLTSASALGPLKLQDLSVCLDAAEAGRLGSEASLHFQHKQARLQALETMADVLKRRIDTLTAKLQGAEAAGAARRGLRLGPSSGPVAPRLTAPAFPGALVPNGDGRAPRDWVGLQARPLLPATYFLDGDALLWRPSPQSRSLSPGCESQLPGVVEEGCWELEKRLRRESFQALSTWAGSPRRVPAAPDPTRGSLWLEDTASARGAGLVLPWSAQSCGQREPGGPPSGDPHSGYLASFQQKTSSFLRSLKLDQQKQEQALALLRQRAEQEVWETQLALDELVFKHRLKELMKKHAAQASPKAAPKLGQPQTCGSPKPKTPSRGTPPARPGSGSSPALGGDTAGSSRVPKKGHVSWADQSACAGPRPAQPAPVPSQMLLARLHAADRGAQQWSAPRPQGDARAASRAPSRGTAPTPQQSLRQQELRAQHPAALLRLREPATEEKARAELARLEHQRGCLGSQGHRAAWAALSERQQQTLSRLEKEQREIQSLRDCHWPVHRDREQVLQQRTAQLTAQSRLCPEPPQDSRPEVKVSETSQRLAGPQGPLAAHRPGSPTSQHPRRSPKRLDDATPPSARQEGPRPRTASGAEGLLQPPRLAWAEDAPEASSRLVDGGIHVGQAEQPHVPLLGLLPLGPLSLGQQLSAAFPAIKAEGTTPAAQLRPRETEEPRPGDPQTEPTAPWAEERPLAPAGSRAGSPQKQSWQPPGGEGPRCPQEARGPEGSEPARDLAPGLEDGPREVGRPRSGEQRIQARGPGDMQVSSWPEAAHLAAASAPAVSEDPLAQLHAPWDLGSGSPGAPASPPTSSASSVSDLSCSSLQEFQKATATLVQLSDSSLSLSGSEAEVTPDVDTSGSGKPSAHDSYGDAGPHLSWGPPPGGPGPGGAGRVTAQRPEGILAGGPGGSCSEAAVAGSLGSERWPLPLPDALSARSDSELSEASSQIWDEDSGETPPEPGTGAEPALGCSSPADRSPDPNSSREPHAPPSFPGAGDGQETSGTSMSLSSGSHAGKPKRASPEETCTGLPSETPSTRGRDAPLSLPSGAFMSEGVGLSKGGTVPPQATGGCREGPWGADPTLSTEGKVLQTLAGPEVPLTLQAPPEVPCGLALPVAGPPPAGGLLTELLSPVDEELSYGSGDLPSRTRRDPLPTAQAEGDSQAGLCSEDFPSPPEEALFPGDWPGSLGEDTSITTSLSEDTLPEALSPGQGRGLEGGLGPSGPAVGSQGSGAGPSLSEGAGSGPVGLPGPSAESLAPSQGACVAEPGLSRLLVAGDAEGPQSPGTEGEEVADLLSTRLSRTILQDSLAALSELAPGAAPRPVF